MRSVFGFFASEDAYPDLDAEGAVSRLSQAVQCRTVNGDGIRSNDGEFARLRSLMKEGYPRVMAAGRMELIGRSVLITIPGSDKSLPPCLYMSHQDVVPVVRGTEGDWVQGPFSGEIADGFVWGRGTLDIKNMVFGILEAAEYLLSRGCGFRRTAYLAFGDDEETFNLGARDIAETLKERGVRLEFVLDEGGGVITDGGMFGAPETAVSFVDLMEKGYADLELTVRSAGGHSSRPFGGSSLERISRAVTQICCAELPLVLPDPIRQALTSLTDHVTEEPLKSLVQDISSNEKAISEALLKDPEAFAYVTTTVAPTMIEGGSGAPNVLPQDMRAVINFRINQGMTAERLFRICRDAVTDPGVKMRFLQSNDPSGIADTACAGYETLVKTASEFYRDVVFVPCMTAGATDARRYEGICGCCLRFSPFMAETEEVKSGVHGTNERIPVRSYLQGIRFLIRMMERSNL